MDHKEVKKLLRELGFHHSWGYFILDGQPNTRVQVRGDFGFPRGFIYPSKNFNYFVFEERIIYRGRSVEDVKKDLCDYFNIKIVHRPRILYRKSDGCPFYLNNKGLYEAQDEHGVEILDPQDGSEERTPNIFYDPNKTTKQK